MFISFLYWLCILLVYAMDTKIRILSPRLEPVLIFQSTIHKRGDRYEISIPAHVVSEKEKIEDLRRKKKLWIIVAEEV